jgi:hypothetical protein
MTKIYERVSIISGTGAAICTAVVAARCKGRGKGRHFDTTEVIEAELHAVNTLSEHDFLDAFTKWHKHWFQCMHLQGEFYEGYGGQ